VTDPLAGLCLALGVEDLADEVLLVCKSPRRRAMIRQSVPLLMGTDRPLSTVVADVASSTSQPGPEARCRLRWLADSHDAKAAVPHGQNYLWRRRHKRLKERNLCDPLPERDRPAILAKVRGASAVTDSALAEQRLERTWPDDAGSLRGGWTTR